VKPKLEEPQMFVEMDDGTGGEWEISSGINKKQQKRKDKIEEKENAAKAVAAAPGQQNVQQNHVPGMAPSKTVFKGQAAPKAASAAVDVSAEVAAAVAAAAAKAAAAAEEAAAAAEKEKEGNAATVTINVPENKIGIVIGPKGSKIKMIQEKTGVSRIDTSGEVFTISGPPEAVAAAQTAIKELIEKGYMSMAFENFSDSFVNVYASSFPDIIGKQGSVIRKLKEELGVEINIPDVPGGKNADSKKHKVSIAGSAVGVEKAKAVINDILMYYHHEITHPGQVHEEMEVADWAYRFIIGSGGSEMRHIQNNYKVRVMIPRETSANPKVVIVGEQDGVDRAKVYMEKLIWNAENKSKGRDKEEGGADDGMGEEGADEPWMNAYLYKRR